MPRRVIALASIASLVLVASASFASPAGACSCARWTRRSIAESDAAFVGVLRDFSSIEAEVPIWTFEVESVHAGELGPEVKVAAPVGGGGCGLPLDVGDRAAVRLEWVEPGEPTLTETDVAMWHSNLCLTGDPEQLASLGAPHPPDPGIGAGPVPEKHDAPPPWIVWGLAGAAVAAIGAATVVLLRRRPGAARG